MLVWFPWRGFRIHLKNLFHSLWGTTAVHILMTKNFEVSTLSAPGLTLLKTAWFYSLTKDVAFFATAVHVGSALGEAALVQFLSVRLGLSSPVSLLQCSIFAFHPSTIDATRS
jgi:hypothetical protein